MCVHVWLQSVEFWVEYSRSKGKEEKRIIINLFQVEKNRDNILRIYYVYELRDWEQKRIFLLAIYHQPVEHK